MPSHWLRDCSRLRLTHVFPHREAHGEEALALEKENIVAQLQELTPRGTELHCKADFDVAVGGPSSRF